jgi:nitroreductase/ferredoxin
MAEYKPERRKNRMKPLVIDQDKCNSCGICAEECPLIIMREGEDLPDMIPGGDVACVKCGHCMAVCPTGALNHALLPRETFAPVKKELMINEQQVVQFLRSRRSIRRYLDKPVEKEKIRRLIKIARYAPTGGNAQMVEWVVSIDRNKIHDLTGAVVDWVRQGMQNKEPGFPAYMGMFVQSWDAGIDTVFWSAPALVIAVAPKEANTGMADLTIALTYFELAAQTMGLGTCWAGLFQRALCASPKARDISGIPEGYPHYYPMMFGYPKSRYFCLPERKTPKIKWM